MSQRFLLEVGCEEIPDWMIEPALEQLAAGFRMLVEERQVGGSGFSVTTEATPRRLILFAEGIESGQRDRTELVLGPPEAAAFGDGKPTPAAEGFARKQGISAAELEIHETPRGRYAGFNRKVQGRSTRDLLAEALPEVILGIHFPKTMYWTGKQGARFIRPIRWIVALLEEDVVPFSVAEVAAGRESRGHRRLSTGTFPLTCGNWVEELRQHFVIVRAQERRQRIQDTLARLLEGSDLSVQPDPALVETLVYLTEYPTPILGEFDPAYLELPEEVLVTVMRHHQKYLSLAKADGTLAPAFLAVMNLDADREGWVRQGNERVLRARFNDARFFVSVDRQRTLEDRVPDLANVTFQAKLGSYLEKTEKVRELAQELAARLGAVPAEADRAALLSKCDLTTGMVKEFTELQGVMGGLYARMEGEPEPVWQAIYDHYRPESMEAAIPRALTGQILSIADKADTLRRCFSIGMIPSGSRDPFALRRAAQGIVKILAEARLPAPLDWLTAGDAQLREFLLDRIRYYFREIRRYRYDEVNAVMAASGDSIPDVEARLEAIRQVRPTENFEPLAASFKRIQNILRQAEFTGDGAVEPGRLEEGPEKRLHERFLEVRAKAVEHREENYRGALEAIASLRPEVDLFFDKVLVNTPDPEIRRNRLALLSSLLSEFSTIADFSEIVTAQPT